MQHQLNYNIKYKNYEYVEEIGRKRLIYNMLFFFFWFLTTLYVYKHLK